jgi:tetratricopeptide (TPR) repeat protein
LEIVSDPKTTQVIFAHIAYRDYFVNEGSPNLGKLDEAVRIYKIYFQVFPHDGLLILKILEMLDAETKFEAVMELLVESKNTTCYDYCSSLDRCCLWFPWVQRMKFFDLVVRAGRETKQMDFVLNMYQSAIRTARRGSHYGVAALTQLLYGLLLYREYEYQDSAIAVWENLIQMSRFSTDISVMGVARIGASIILSSCYFNRASALPSESPEASAYIKKLKGLSENSSHITSNSGLLINTQDSKLLLGRWYHLQGMTQEAKSCFKPHVRLALDLLTDDEIDNHYVGYNKLRLVFLYSGHHEDVITAFECLRSTQAIEFRHNIASSGRPRQADRVSPGHSVGAQAVKKDDDESGSLAMACDGPCKAELTHPRGIFLCYSCLDNSLCENCMELSKVDARSISPCSPEHDFLFIDLNEPRCKKGWTRRKGQDIRIEDWLEDIKREWGLKGGKEKKST